MNNLIHSGHIPGEMVPARLEMIVGYVTDPRQEKYTQGRVIGLTEFEGEPALELDLLGVDCKPQVIASEHCKLLHAPFQPGEPILVWDEMCEGDYNHHCVESVYDPEITYTGIAHLEESWRDAPEYKEGE